MLWSVVEFLGNIIAGEVKPANEGVDVDRDRRNHVAEENDVQPAHCCGDPTLGTVWWWKQFESDDFRGGKMEGRR
jgi:hypothetical protein